MGMAVCPACAGVIRSLAMCCRGMVGLPRMRGDDPITQATVAEHLHRSPNYVSDRVTMKRSWTMQDIDALAKLFGLPNGFALIDEARGITKEGR